MKTVSLKEFLPQESPVCYYTYNDSGCTWGMEFAELEQRVADIEFRWIETQKRLWMSNLEADEYTIQYRSGNNYVAYPHPSS